MVRIFPRYDRLGWAAPAGLAELSGLVAMAAAGPSPAAGLTGVSAAPPRPPGPAADPARDGEERTDRIRALVELAQRGDAEAFGLIYAEYVDLVYRYVYVRVGSHSLAEDLTSETFLRALRRLDGFTWQGRDIGAWFVTIARNLITDHHRSGRSRMEISTDDLLGGDGPTWPGRAGDGAPAGPEDAALARARHERLVETLRLLRPEQQECLVLRFFHEMSLAETAQVLGRSEGAVKQLQLRAVRALAAHLEGERP